MYVETLNNKFDFYVKSFIGMLGVLAIPLNRVSFMVTMAYYLGHRFYLRKQKIRSLSYLIEYG